jgi:hypothetical protein
MKLADYRCPHCGQDYPDLEVRPDHCCRFRDCWGSSLVRIFTSAPVGHFHGPNFSRSSTGASTVLRHQQEKALHPMEEPKVKT